jgi:exopolyphosphatase / guanosine-5'-triphosphate,3'-diphosphate pyrophosphatase
MKLAAIDIGSNAIRFQISSVLDTGPKVLFKKMEYVRFPLRLGHDVFNDGKLSKKSIDKFMKLMHTYKLLLELYEADDYMICATSAMRESKNGKELVKQVFDVHGITINIIDGQMEAELINKAIASYLTDKTYLHIDVGGGSTELNLYFGGKKIQTKSFKIGSVRVLEHHDSPKSWEEMQAWIVENVKKKYGMVTSVGTGGNISKIFELSNVEAGKSLSLSKIKEIRKTVSGLSMEKRIYELQMNPDRADVIVPASNIYIQVMEWASSKSIIVPEVGLKDGMILHLYEKNSNKKKIEFVNTQDQSKGRKTMEL